MLEPHLPLHSVWQYFIPAIEQGLDIEQVLTDSLVPEGAGDDHPLSPAQFNLVVLNVMAALNDEIYGLGVKPLKAGSSTLALHAISGCHSVVAAISVLIRFMDLTESPMRFTLNTANGVSRLSIHIDTRNGAPYPFLEGYWLGWVGAMLSWFAGRWIPAHGAIRLGPGPLNRAGLHPRFRWRQAGALSYVQFPASCLEFTRSRDAGTDTPLRDAFWFLERIGPGSVESGVLDLAFDWQGDTPVPTLTELASRSGISVSTLSRRLRARGLTFRELVNQARAAAGLDLLRTTDLPVDEVAYRLGYTEARSFRRFLKSNTGHTPLEVRAMSMPAVSSPVEALIHSRRVEIMERLNF